MDNLHVSVGIIGFLQVLGRIANTRPNKTSNMFRQRKLKICRPRWQAKLQCFLFFIYRNN